MKPITRTMWLAVDSFGHRKVFDKKPYYKKIRCEPSYWDNDDCEGNYFYISSVKPPAHPEKSLKKVIVTIEEA